MPAKSFEIELRELNFAGLRWDGHGNERVLALHGWLDNAASFARLAPLLRGCYTVAPDLAGHGYSQHRPPSGSYNIWDDLPDLVALITWLGWDSFHLIGHSRGAAVAFLLAAAFPEKVRSLTLIDGLLPLPWDSSLTANQLRNFTEDMLGWNENTAAVLPDSKTAIELRARKSSLSYEAARQFVERDLAACAGGGVRWCHDPRVRGTSAQKLTASQIKILLQNFQSPLQVLLGENGIVTHSDFQQQLDWCPQASYHRLPGGHHLHLEGEHVQQVADLINAFINEHGGKN